MTLQEKLVDDMKDSMRAGNAERTGTVRLLISSMKNERIKAGHELSEDEELKVIQREAKQRRDSITLYREGNREDLATVEEKELAIIYEYLPRQLSDDELAALVAESIQALGASSLQQMGAVIADVRKKAGASADGATVSRLVKEKLGS